MNYVTIIKALSVLPQNAIRIFQNVKLVDAQAQAPVQGQCWEWTASKRGNYGCLKINSRSTDAHKASYQIFIGEVPPDLHVYHKCSNKLCVNPDHLFAGVPGHFQRKAKAEPITT